MVGGSSALCTMYTQLFRLLLSQVFCSIGEAHGSIPSSVSQPPPATGATKLRKGDLAAAEAWLRWRPAISVVVLFGRIPGWTRFGFSFHYFSLEFSLAFENGNSLQLNTMGESPYG